MRDAKVLAATGSWAVGVSVGVSGRRATGCPASSSLPALAEETDGTSKTWAARRAALAPRAPTRRSERGETSLSGIRCGCIFRSIAGLRPLTERFGQHMFGSTGCQLFSDRTVRSLVESLIGTGLMGRAIRGCPREECL